jgi:hypothetical protein
VPHTSRFWFMRCVGILTGRNIRFGFAVALNAVYSARSGKTLD